MTLESTYKMPEGSPYRLAVETIIKERQQFVEAFERKDVEKIETFPEHLKALSLEDLKRDAESECQLAKKMALDWKPYLPLAFKAPNGVWPLNLSTPTGPTFKETEKQQAGSKETEPKD